MNFRAVLYFLGKIFLILAALMLLPLWVCIYYNLHGFSEAGYSSFIIPIIILAVLGLLLTIKKPKSFNFYAKEGFAICGLAWITMSLLGALPFVISGCIPSYIDAFFESASGFSTTGATILTEIHSLPKSILFWRSFTHWIGGMGILSFMIAIIPKAKGNQMFIMRAEVPGPTTSKVVSKISSSARILYVIYFVMTILEIIVLFFGNRITGDNIRFYDCVVTAFATAGTGGFSVLNNSILGYASSFTEWVLIIFMFLFGINFNLYYFMITKRFGDAFRDEELRGYLIINITGAALITLNIYHMYSSIGDAVRDSLFAVNTVMSTTGYSTADFNQWPTFSKTILVILMCVGCSAGSTGGGLKIVRIELLFKQMICDFKQMLRPNSVVSVRMNGRPVNQNIIKGVNSYFNIYIITMAFSVFLLSLDNMDTTSTFTAVIACYNNIGPGLGAVGPTGNFADFSVFSKLVLIFDMLAGRLELFPMLLLFSPNTWRKSK
ncbi:MAG: TrkH family potassium uptake protein [Clostridium sp.]|nr:TrkH family potassium uptake protein [Clostridium sp.]